MTDSSRLENRGRAALHLDGTSARAVSLADRAWSLWIWQGLRSRSSVQPRRWANQHESTGVAFDGAIAESQHKQNSEGEKGEGEKALSWGQPPNAGNLGNKASTDYPALVAGTFCAPPFCAPPFCAPPFCAPWYLLCARPLLVRASLLSVPHIGLRRVISQSGRPSRNLFKPASSIKDSSISKDLRLDISSRYVLRPPLASRIAVRHPTALYTLVVRWLSALTSAAGRPTSS